MYILIPSNRRLLLTHFTLQIDRPHTIVTSAFFHTSTLRLAFEYVAYFNYATTLAQFMGESTSCTAILASAIGGSLGLFYFQRVGDAPWASGLQGVVAGLRVLVVLVAVRVGGGGDAMWREDVVRG
ncbi:hypothetical protein HDU98_004634, partial [Podochytrium sp. JEL0797]